MHIHPPFFFKIYQSVRFSLKAWGGMLKFNQESERRNLSVKTPTFDFVFKGDRRYCLANFASD